MTLNLGSPWLSRLPLSNLPTTANTKPSVSLFFLIFNTTTSISKPQSFSASNKFFNTKASLSESQNEVAEPSELFNDDDDDDLLDLISASKHANEALDLIAENSNPSGGGGVVSGSDCCSIISAAFDRNNVDLALSVFSAMRSSFNSGAASGEMASFSQRWKWSRPDIHTYTLLVQGLAASLRVSDALKIIGAVSRVGVSPGEEVPFGKIVRCPTCMIAVTVAQPQHGIQIVSCSKCRYQYELVSGDIVSIETEEIRIPYCRTQHGGTCMEKGAKIPANKEAKLPCCSSLYCGGDSIRDGTHSQICY
ncbi:hypothetical protein CsSME_00050663 [Camellia sinensis var. sinensis]